MNMVAVTLFPAVIANLLYHYLSKRYGKFPNIIYRAVTTLYIYVIPVRPALSNALVAFFNILVPIAIFAFIDSLYEKKRRYAFAKKQPLAVALTAVVLVLMISTVALISNQFSYGMLVIATESMTGEINKSDAVIFKRYEDDKVLNGQVIVFEKNSSMIVHRVVEIEHINGQTRYYTKGDANEENDLGFITNSDIRGIVRYKIPYIGYPTLWMRSLFKR
jgi:signal peptidase